MVEAIAKFDRMYSEIRKDGITSENYLFGFRCMVKSRILVEISNRIKMNVTLEWSKKSRSNKFVTNFCVFLFQNTINRTHAYERVCSNRGYQLVILRLCRDWVGILSKCTVGMFWRPYRFHMTSRPPYWCSRQNNETTAMSVSQINPES